MQIVRALTRALTFIIMKKIKITINSEDRIVVIPMEYNPEDDSMHFYELQMEPIPEKDDEDLSKDIVIKLTTMILSAFNQIKQD